jgi:peroxiredoxin-like protein
MQDLPHHYKASATAAPQSNVLIKRAGLPDLVSAPPAEFGGPGDQWSPEDLLVAAVADCFILTFKAIARASQLSWDTLDCEVEGTLDRVDRVTRFTAFQVRARLAAPPDTDSDKASRLLHKAEAACLITNSLSAQVHLDAEVITTS